MSSFEDLESAGMKEAADHSSDVDKGVTDAENQIDQRTGNAADAEVKKAGSDAEQGLGIDQTAGAPPSEH